MYFIHDATGILWHLHQAIIMSIYLQLNSIVLQKLWHFVDEMFKLIYLSSTVSHQPWAMHFTCKSYFVAPEVNIRGCTSCWIGYLYIKPVAFKNSVNYGIVQTNSCHQYPSILYLTNCYHIPYRQQLTFIAVEQILYKFPISTNVQETRLALDVFLS